LAPATTSSNAGKQPTPSPVPSFPPRTSHHSYHSSKKATADKSLQYDDHLKQLLQRIEALEIKQKIQEKAVPHMGQMFDDIQILKGKETETSGLITKILAGQALSLSKLKLLPTLK
jgi:hypothetical protein